MNLPIPEFRVVREVVHHHRWTHPPGSPSVESIVLITPDPNAGRRYRYSVIRIALDTGEARCIGRELPLKLARLTATRASARDGKHWP